MDYVKRYERDLSKFEEAKQNILDDVREWLEDVYKKPLELGNMLFWVCEDEMGKKVPAYKYNNQNEGNDFQPMYDRMNTREFGWYDFKQVCFICNKIKETIGKELGLDWQDEEWIY